MKKLTVEEYVGVITHVSLRAVGAAAHEILVDGEGVTDEKPEKLWFILSWAADGIGFGEATFYADGGVFICDNESMSQTFIEALLVKLARTAKLMGK